MTTLTCQYVSCHVTISLTQEAEDKMQIAYWWWGTMRSGGSLQSGPHVTSWCLLTVVLNVVSTKSGRHVALWWLTPFPRIACSEPHLWLFGCPYANTGNTDVDVLAWLLLLNQYGCHICRHCCRLRHLSGCVVISHDLCGYSCCGARLGGGWTLFTVTFRFWYKLASFSCGNLQMTQTQCHVNKHVTYKSISTGILIKLLLQMVESLNVIKSLS